MALTVRSRALRSVAFVGLLGALTPQVYAQETQEETDDPATLDSEAEIESGQDADATNQGDITITGSRIRRPNLTSTVPITSVGGDEFFETGSVSVGDALNDLPALRSTFGQSNSTQFLGTAGLNLLDLRGLGTQRTLVLVNGRRHVPGDILNNANSPDVNTIPTDLIERVDVVTGGNSAIYGSDAIAGVVNFILKRDFDGVQLRGQGGISKYGDAGAYYTSLLAGRNFADGRGNVTINLEYARQNDYYASGRPNLRQANGFVAVDTDPAGATNGSDGTPDAVFAKDIRSGVYSNSGTFLSFIGQTHNGSPVYTPFIFQPNGTLVAQTGTRFGRGFTPGFLGGNGDNFRDGRQFGLMPKLDRYSANLLARFKVSEALEPFIEAKYSRTDSLGNASGPFFTGNSTGSPRDGFRTASNPFLTQQARNIINDYYGDYYDANGDYGGDGIPDATQFDRRFSIYRNVVEFGNREEEGRRETYRMVAGIRGDLGNSWNYEVSANYGAHRERTNIFGNVDLQRYLLAIDAVRAPNGQIVCRSQIDPSAAVAFENVVVGQEAFAQARLAADVAACTPVNLFGSGNITQANRDYLLSNSSVRAKINQFVFNAFISGNSGKWFELPGGPVGFAAGVEYRKESAFYDQDDFTQTGLSFYNAIPTWDNDDFGVKEVFGEIRLPILRDTPFFHELTVNFAGRISDYKGATGTVYAYNAGVDWAPVQDLRFRGNYSRAVRAPNLSDLSFPISQNFAPAPADPCSLSNRNTTLRQTNCLALGVPANYDFTYLQSLAYLSGGNPALNEETSDSYTLGAVFQPRFLPGFALSVDYYDITVNDVITSLSAQAIINACVDLPDINNQFCGQFQRAGAGGGPRGEIQGQILENSLEVVPLNFAKLKVRGIDAELSYRRKLGNIGNLTTRVVYTRVLENSSFLNPVTPNFGNSARGELGDPVDAFNLDINLKSGPVTLGYEMRYLGKMSNGAIENYNSYQGRPPQNADAFDVRYYPAVFYHDFRLGIDAGERFNFYMGVDNAFNRNPPYGLSGIGAGSGIYTNRGRFFYAGAVAKF
ncbi:MAG TPA: TonB-dependent receptor [Allosphingosinicella sp.]|jgi:outer membrane receptor protein involved in Fe transport